MSMVQYGLWPNCCNACKFCLRKERIPLERDAMFKRIYNVQRNLDYVDWKDKFKHGISILGGEIYFIEDVELQNAYLALIDDIIEKVLKPKYFEHVKYSTVSNGIYDTTFLFKVMDKIVSQCGIGAVDFNVSYDLKYRFQTEADRLRCIKTINDFHQRYNYKVGVQMILTQYVIDAINKGEFSIDKFEQETCPGSILTFLYPHKIAKELGTLPDFFFKRSDFINFISKFSETHPEHFLNFKYSVINSSKFKYTGLREKGDDASQAPVLSDDKNVYMSCGHSVLYKCYSDSNECMLCDVEEFY